MGLERGRVGKRPVLVFVVRRSSSIVLKSSEVNRKSQKEASSFFFFLLLSLFFFFFFFFFLSFFQVKKGREGGRGRSSNATLSFHALTDEKNICSWLFLSFSQMM